MNGFNITDLLDLVDLSDLEDEKKSWLKINLMNLNKHYETKYGQALNL
jgi:hypothetical protein